MAKAKAKPTIPPAPTQGHTLLAEAIATDDDATWQVYADWLEERGDPAAQLVRLTRAATPRTEEIDVLIAKHHATWIEPIESWCRPIGDLPLFERGMYARAYGTAGKYAQKASQHALLEASLRFGVRETMLRGKAGKVFTCETLRWTRELWWWDCQLDDAGMAALASSPHLAALPQLTLEKVRCTNAGIRALASLGTLEHLGLRAPVYYSKWDAAAVIDVVERLPRLASLDLSGLNHIDPRVLGDAPAMAKLTRLDLHVSRLADFAHARQLTNLTELRVDPLRIESADVEALLENPTFAKLERLRIDTYETKLPAPLLERIANRFDTTWPRR